ncbi:large subunit of alpha-aminoadipate reductase [Polyrhizophydium stewartii]|uniref:Alpha-aminoadipate reductase n=1 Tax=Polyrhizophydium stewartii TaxID=2732419 RepID=A0ABR4MVP6_9FUNG|nr:large subunit of alpha-aminoadipate reductase [Polyrhizophydium stewartii]
MPANDASAAAAAAAARAARWRTRLAALTELILPTDYPRPVPPRSVEADLVADISDAAALAVMRLALAANARRTAAGAAPSVAPFTVLLAAFAALLHRFTGERDIPVGSSSASTNPLVLRLAVRESATFLDVVDAVLEAEQDALADEIPFADLVRAVDDSTSLMSHADTKDASRHPLHPQEQPAQPSLFKVRFFNLTDTTADTLASSMTSSSCDLTVFISQAPTLRRMLPIQIKIVYNAVLFSAQRVSDMLDQLQLLLSSAAEAQAAPVDQISLVTQRATAVLPDPRADLNWSRFEGAITDVFAANAHRFPDRLCVLESVAQDTAVGTTRAFSYAQINRAANIVAHHLIQNGVRREDVVVLYSYRGVDLVVAIMGVLRAGATFSVIDPAYPPPRQIVYLSVAQPRGLIVLAKAGVLHADVRGYIRDNLAIVCEIPWLEIADDGSLRGDPDRDLFSAVAALADEQPSLTIGPDSIGTLSFTSGSTGTPKGVRGRHFSLTHFYPWMASEFGLSDKERFTMLSGIAHDPIQRDIFTPLFLGACLCIPTAEDIGTPGRLAEWMAEQEITITHLTPAMGQLLSANAVHPIPTLRHAFFVGDVLTKRDVLRLQHLAPNTHVINMYGTTETQRAVSFLKIPPLSANPAFLTEQKDIMSAGRGMHDVQLLIINSSGLLCGVGEVGEIYVRSSGLAEGYLALADVTAAKFIPNPFNPDGPARSAADAGLQFYLGPRDRMYRTGDLGRYKPDGTVECTGRADDQVKIRGFRIELGEIDMHLSQHPSVRENVTLVRRDKYEEKTLVTYFVPVSSAGGVAETVKDIRQYLRQKLPAYAVPTVFVPLTRMPLTPNGKIDKNALPFPDTALAAGGSGSDRRDNGAGLTLTQRSVRALWSALLGIPDSSVDLDSNFFDVGGHSILATRLIFEIRKSLAIDAPLGMVYQSPTLRDMARELDAIRGLDLAMTDGAFATTESGENASPTLAHARQEGAAATSVAEKHAERQETTAFDYAADLDVVDDESLAANGLPAPAFPPPRGSTDGRPPVIFLTGVTGFLGTFVLRSLLTRFASSRVVCLVRAPSAADAMARIESSCRSQLVWEDAWAAEKRIEALAGDLGAQRFGLTAEDWDRLAAEVDVIVHNGALVHWVYPYAKLRAANVLGTKTALRLATTRRLKPLHFVSSTSVLDTADYVKRLEIGESVYESDSLEDSRAGLRSGYGQTKWVAEKLVMRARGRGVPATIVRPGYIVGDSVSGVTNTDDFLWRLVKGCVQLGKVPRIANVVNMCSVDYVAESIAEIVASPESTLLGTFHMWNSDGFRFDDMFTSLAAHGYAVEAVDYMHWRTALMEFTLASADTALFPLLHFVLDDLPTSTKSPALDDSNTAATVRDTRVRAPNMRSLMPLYLGYLVATGFLAAPASGDLPRRPEWDAVAGRAVGRSGR